MTDSLRIALLHPSYWPEVRRGSERFLHDLAVGLAARGHRPRIITSHAGLPSTRLEEGVEVVRTWRPPAGRLRRRGFEDHLTHLPGTYRALARGDDDIAHALFPTDGLVGARWRRRTGRPAVFSYMGLPDHPYLASRRLRATITRDAAAGADATIALSAAAAAALDRWLGIEARVIAPGVDISVFAPAQAPSRAGAPTVVCPAAATEPRKRVALLAEACSRAGARLILSRPAPEFEDLGHVEVRDLDDRTALVDAYREAWVCALPSRSEAFGLVLVEALACGTPVVATNAGGMAEIVDDPRVGRLFDGDEPDALATALSEALALSGERSTPARCRSRAEEFSLEATVDAYVDLYGEVLGNHVV